jgi:O-succinylbenzoic acid--CoA ligase
LAHKISTRFFVIGIPDEKYGEVLVLVIEGNPITIGDSFFNDLLPYEKPKAIYFVANFKETESGKVKRSATLNLI